MNDNLNEMILELKADVSKLFDFAGNISDAVVPMAQKLSEIVAKQEEMNDIQQLLIPSDYLHVCTNTYNNIGDRVLSLLVKKTIEHFKGRTIYWSDRNVCHDFGIREAILSNKFTAIIVGGGGLFFDNNENHSWQWGIDHEAIDALDIPVYIFAVGYNQFRNQGPLGDDFREDLNYLASKCGFIGLRNMGSIECVKRYLLPEYHDRIVYQPCPTTIISKIYGFGPRPALPEGKRGFIALNIAFDHSEYRFRDEAHRDRIMYDLLRVTLALSNRYDIKYYAHFNADDPFSKLMKEQGIPFEYVDLSAETDMDNVIERYREPELVIGMRGHAQMIPFGCLTPIVSIISHDKMKWFLDDICHPEWGVDVNDPDFAEKLFQTSLAIIARRNAIVAEIDSLQNQIYDITAENVNRIIYR